MSCETNIQEWNEGDVDSEKQLQQISDALASTDGSDRQRIAKVGVHLLGMLLNKNVDYKSAVFKRPRLVPRLEPGDGILVRASDKIERIEALNESGAQPSFESVSKSVADLAGYLILWLARPEVKE